MSPLAPAPLVVLPIACPPLSSVLASYRLTPSCPHALHTQVDLLAIFARVLIILINNKAKREEQERRRRSSSSKTRRD